MSVLTDLIYGGSNVVAGLTESAVGDAIARYGSEKEIAFPDTAYFFPAIYAATGVRVKTLGDLVPCVAVLKSLITNQADLGQALNAGLATLLGAEILEGLKYIDGADPYETKSGMGFISDDRLQALNLHQAPGIAILLGQADKVGDLVSILRDYHARGILTFLVGDVIEQCADVMEQDIIPLGHEVSDVIHVMTLAVRAALIFGGIQPGDLAGLLDYIRVQFPAFINTFGPIDAVVISTAAGAAALGFPTVVDMDLADNQVPGILVSVCDHAETVNMSLALRGIPEN